VQLYIFYWLLNTTWMSYLKRKLCTTKVVMLDSINQQSILAFEHRELQILLVHLLLVSTISFTLLKHDGSNICLMTDLVFTVWKLQGLLQSLKINKHVRYQWKLPKRSEFVVVPCTTVDASWKKRVHVGTFRIFLSIPWRFQYSGGQIWKVNITIHLYIPPDWNFRFTKIETYDMRFSLWSNQITFPFPSTPHSFTFDSSHL
jgi:hypothetical protein